VGLVRDAERSGVEHDATADPPGAGPVRVPDEHESRRRGVPQGEVGDEAGVLPPEQTDPQERQRAGEQSPRTSAAAGQRSALPFPTRRVATCRQHRLEAGPLLGREGLESPQVGLLQGRGGGAPWGETRMDRIAVGREDGAVGELEMAPRSDQRIVVAREEGDAHPQPLRAATQALDAAGGGVAMVRQMQFRDVSVEDQIVGLGDHRLEGAGQVEAAAAEVEIRDDEGAATHDEGACGGRGGRRGGGTAIGVTAARSAPGRRGRR